MRIHITDEMRALPRLQWTELFQPAGDGPPPAEVEAMRAYFAKFVAWQKNARGEAVCVGCTCVISGGIQGVLLGAMEGRARLDWSLTHGESHCSRCEWPSRSLHYNVGPIEHMAIPLQYHPAVVTLRHREAA